VAGAELPRHAAAQEQVLRRDLEHNLWCSLRSLPPVSSTVFPRHCLPQPPAPSPCIRSSSPKSNPGTFTSVVAAAHPSGRGERPTSDPGCKARRHCQAHEEGGDLGEDRVSGVGSGHMAGAELPRCAATQENRYYTVIWNIICGTPSTRSLLCLSSPPPATASLSHWPQAVRPSLPKSNPSTFTSAATAAHPFGRGRAIEFRSRMQGAAASSTSRGWR
jgi:hypothetical protein